MLNYSVFSHPLFLIPLALTCCVPLIRWTAGSDRHLQGLLFVAFFARLAGAFTNYAFLLHSFGDLRDIDGYHSAAVHLSGRTEFLTSAAPAVFLTGPTGRLSSAMSLWVTFVDGRVEGLFVVFATLSFIGTCQILKAVTSSVPDLARRRYIYLLLFSPSLLLHPTVPGKDAWMMLALGFVAMGLSRLAQSRMTVGAVGYIASGLTLAWVVRPHIAGVAAMSIALMLFTTTKISLPPVARLLIGAPLLVAVTYFMTQLLAQKNFSSIDQVLDSTAAYTGQGGSSFATLPFLSPIGAPVGIATVLARPFPFEALGLAQLLTSAEGLFVAWLTIGALKIAPRLRSLRQSPLTQFAIFLLLFTVPMFASISNFGTLARQRVQVWPFLFILLCL